MASPEYFPIDGAEEIGLYEPGCFHPIMIGDILNKRYHIVNKLGYKGYSTVWLVRDSQTENYVAVRVGVAEEDSSLRKETEVLRALSAPLPESSSARQHLGRRAVPVLLDEFELHGLKGVYRCYTMAPAGDSLNDTASTGFFPLNVARALSVELVLAVSYTHSQGFVHGDICLRNILVNIPSNPSDLQGLSIDQYTEKYELYTSPVEKRNGEPLPPNVPPEAVIPAYHGKRAKEFNLSDAHIFPTLAKHSHQHRSFVAEKTPIHHSPQKCSSNSKPRFHIQRTSGAWVMPSGSFLARNAHSVIVGLTTMR